MASITEHKSLEALEREITCGICQEYYTEPKILPCLHYYCKQCILRLATRNVNGQLFACPECRNNVTLSKEDVDKLKTAFNINRLMPIVLQLKQTRINKNLCEKHNGPLMIYCFKCKSLICQNCTVKDHQNHNFAHCNISAPAAKEELTEELKLLKQQKENIALIFKSIETTRQEIVSQGDNVATNIHKSFKLLRDIINKREQELADEAAGSIRIKIEKLSAKEENLSVASAEIQSIVDYVEQCVRHYTDNEVMSMHTEIRKQIEETKKEHGKSLMTFEPEEEADLGVEVKCGNALQQLCQTQANIIQLSVDPTKCTVTMEDGKDLKMDKSSTAVVVLRLSNNSISRRHHRMSSSLRSSYNNVTTPCCISRLKPGQYSIQYTPTVRGHHELTVSVDGQQVKRSPFPLFVSIHPTQLDERVKVWKNINNPSGITVTSTGEVLVCDRHCRIIKFDKDGNMSVLISRSALSPSVFSWLSGNIVKYKLEVDDTNSIYCISDNSHKILRCNQDGSNCIVGTTEYDRLTGLAVFGEEVFLCGWNGGVSVYDRDLNYKRRILQNNKINIAAISADCRGNLYCASRNGSVKVFSNHGVYLHTFGRDEEGEKKVDVPRGLCVYGDYVYVCNYDINNRSISVFTTNGSYVTSFGDFNCPHSVCVDKDGFVYVSSVYDNSVHCF